MTSTPVLTERGRQHVETHPWIDYRFDLSRFDPRTWMLLGEAASKCDHIAHVPLRPEVSKKLLLIYLSKGAHGTTSIEGNTLSEEEVMQRVDGQLELPLSREYLGAEIDNIVELINSVTRRTLNGDPPDVSADTIKEYHRTLFRGQPVSDDNRVGEFRTHSVTVARYRGAPAEDCEYLIDKLCHWLKTGFEPPAGREDLRFALNVVKAMMAHLYIAWVHPFGDGNGRIARLVEFQLLFQAGVPLPACHVLSDHYNRTREAYYHALDITSRDPRYPIEFFINYAMQGFVDELREQLTLVRDHQHDLTWENHVHGVFRDQDTPAKRRQKHIALDLPKNAPVARGKVRLVSPRIADEYAGKTAKTVSRDLNALEDLGLIYFNREGVWANRALTQGLLATRAEVDERADL